MQFFFSLTVTHSKKCNKQLKSRLILSLNAHRLILSGNIGVYLILVYISYKNTISEIYAIIIKRIRHKCLIQPYDMTCFVEYGTFNKSRKQHILPLCCNVLLERIYSRYIMRLYIVHVLNRYV